MLEEILTPGFESVLITSTGGSAHIWSLKEDVKKKTLIIKQQQYPKSSWINSFIFYFYFPPNLLSKKQEVQRHVSIECIAVTDPPVSNGGGYFRVCGQFPGIEKKLNNEKVMDICFK